MDYFGRVVDELTELWERIECSPHGAEAVPVLRALERTMRAAVKLENERVRRREATGLIGHNRPPSGEAERSAVA